MITALKNHCLEAPCAVAEQNPLQRVLQGDVLRKMLRYLPSEDVPRVGSVDKEWHQGALSATQEYQKWRVLRVVARVLNTYREVEGRFQWIETKAITHRTRYTDIQRWNQDLWKEICEGLHLLSLAKLIEFDLDLAAYIQQMENPEVSENFQPLRWRIGLIDENNACRDLQDVIQVASRLFFTTYMRFTTDIALYHGISIVGRIPHEAVRIQVLRYIVEQIIAQANHLIIYRGIQPFTPTEISLIEQGHWTQNLRFVEYFYNPDNNYLRKRSSFLVMEAIRQMQNPREEVKSLISFYHYLAKNRVFFSPEEKQAYLVNVFKEISSHNRFDAFYSMYCSDGRVFAGVNNVPLRQARFRVRRQEITQEDLDEFVNELCQFLIRQEDWTKVAQLALLVENDAIRNEALRHVKIPFINPTYRPAIITRLKLLAALGLVGIFSIESLAIIGMVIGLIMIDEIIKCAVLVRNYNDLFFDRLCFGSKEFDISMSDRSRALKFRLCYTLNPVVTAIAVGVYNAVFKGFFISLLVAISARVSYPGAQFKVKAVQLAPYLVQASIIGTISKLARWFLGIDSTRDLYYAIRVFPWSIYVLPNTILMREGSNLLKMTPYRLAIKILKTLKFGVI